MDKILNDGPHSQPSISNQINQPKRERERERERDDPAHNPNQKARAASVFTYYWQIAKIQSEESEKDPREFCFSSLYNRFHQNLG
jgi:hypothetical protein